MKSGKRIVESTDDGYKMEVWATVSYRGPDGSFVSRDEYVAARQSDGYGNGGYGR